MKKLSKEAYLTLREGAKVIEADAYGDKVLLLPDDTYLKLFRVKRLITSARLFPYSKRFVTNAIKLEKLGIPTVNTIDIYNISSIQRTAVHYRPLPGLALRILPNGMDAILAKSLGDFIRRLHEKGIYFRSLHLGNIVLTPENQLGLIDISDMQFYGKSLSQKLRLRNFKHLLRIPEDNPFITEQKEAFLSAYSNNPDTDHKLASKLEEILDNA